MAKGRTTAREVEAAVRWRKLQELNEREGMTKAFACRVLNLTPAGLHSMLYKHRKSTMFPFKD